MVEGIPPRRASRTLASAVLSPSDPLWSDAWSLRALHIPAVWNQDSGGPAPVVAVVDTGVDSGQPDLQGALVPGYATLDDGTGTADGNGHGTFVSGIIAARSDNGLGVTSVCWTCVVMPVKTMSAAGVGTSSTIAAGIRWAADNGARVINMSFVLSGPQQDVADALAYAHDRGVVLVAAAGNAGGTEETFPAAYPNVIGVAASQADGSIYPWSQHGSWVDVAAPGCSPSTAPNGAYAMFCGTSAATAIVSGVVGLALAAVPGATNVDVERALTGTAVPVPGASVAFGEVDAQALVAALRAGS